MWEISKEVSHPYLVGILPSRSVAIAPNGSAIFLVPPVCSNIKIMKDKLKWIDDELRKEMKSAGANRDQVALAELLESIGNWPVFLTLTFRPNKNEEVVSGAKGDYERNMRVSWTEGDKVARSRPNRNGAVKTGTRRVAPGWSNDRALKVVIQWITGSKDLRTGRWFACVEPHKFRSCYHAHVLHAGNVDAHWESIAEDWQEKFGRFRFDLVRDSNGMANYLAKQYVGKRYLKEDYKFAFSRSCKRPQMDETPPLLWNARHQLFLRRWKDTNVTKRSYIRIKGTLD